MARKILLIVLDQCRADCLAGALSDALDLPNIRRLMSDGVCFQQHYTVTTPCGPSRASLLTGLYAMNHRSVRNGAPLDRHHANMAWEVRRAGVEPLLFGYTDTSTDPRDRSPADPDLYNYEGLAPGFNKIVSMRLDTNFTWRAALKERGYSVPAEPSEIFRPVTQNGQEPQISDPALYRAEDSDTAFLTDETLKALSMRESQSWLSFVSYIRPHPPLVAPAPYNRLYSPDSLPAPNNGHNRADYQRQHPYFAAAGRHRGNTGLYWDFEGNTGEIGAADTAALRAVYCGLVSEVDHHVGRLLDYLDDSGLADETLVILTADHGETLGDHYLWGKQNFYDPSFRVPLIIRDPRQSAQAGGVIEAMTESIDILPTITDWLGLDENPALNGRSLLPLVAAQTPADWRDHILVEVELGRLGTPTVFQEAFGVAAEACNFAVLREKDTKYVHFNGGVPPLLFDLAADPLEHHNCAGDPAMLATELRLLRKLMDHRMTHAHHALSQIDIGPNGAVSHPRGRQNHQ